MVLNWAIEGIYRIKFHTNWSIHFLESGSDESPQFLVFSFMVSIAVWVFHKFLVASGEEMVRMLSSAVTFVAIQDVYNLGMVKPKIMPGNP